MSWQQRGPQLAVCLLIGGDMVYKDMLRVAFGLSRPAATVFLFETKKPDVSLSRNILAAQAIREKAEWLFWLDMDVVPPLDVVARLLAHNLPVISGLYWRRYGQLEPCAYKMSPQGLPVPYSTEELALFGSQILPVEAVGMGCCLMHSSVLNKMKSTVEEFELIDPDSNTSMICWKFFESIIKTNVNLSEDVVFCSRAKGLGYQIFVDLSLRCGHLVNVMVKEGIFKQTPLVLGKDV